MTSEQPPTLPSKPTRIHRLPEDVINRIAAGEVVIRPSAALKELLENSLDAGATAITVTAREGGLKLLQVTDNGKGILHDDLPILCERFTTSKISQFEDLESVATFGFRGEALASISHVSRLSVLTKTKDSNVAFKASYFEGALRGTPEPTAGVDGTIITIEDMFYNLPTRRRALKSSSDEYRSVVDVVTRYSIRYPHIAFICRRQQPGTASRQMLAADLRTESNSSLQNNIRNAFGTSVSNETVSFELDLQNLNAKVSATVSTANFSMKKGIFILFINGRLVECMPFKRAIWTAYSAFLPKSGHPFVYIELQLPPGDLDVNVHPTKKEVRFLDEAAVISAVVDAVSANLKGSETSRTFLTQSVLFHKQSLSLTAGEGDEAGNAERFSEENALNLSSLVNAGQKENGTDAEDSEIVLGSDTHRSDFDEEIDDGEIVAIDDDFVPEHDESHGASLKAVESQMRREQAQTFLDAEKLTELTQSGPPASKRNLYPKDKIRTGANAPVGLYDVYLSKNDAVSSAVGIQAKRRRRPSAIPLLTSVENLLNNAIRNSHKGMAQVLKEHLFIGVASEKFVLLQHGTQLLLADIEKLVVQLFYQQALIRFADFNVLKLDPPAPVKFLIDRFLDTQPSFSTDRRISSESCVNILKDKQGILLEYYRIAIIGADAESVQCEQLPLILPDVMLDLKFLGQFLYHLAADTDWTAEEPCFDDICMLLADMYGKHWTPLHDGDGSDDGGKEDDNGTPSADTEAGADGSGNEKRASEGQERKHRREWILRHVLFAGMRSDYYPPKSFYTQKVVREITSTSRLYKVFERC